LFSTHGMEQAEKVCDAVCIIARGKIVIEGKLLDIKRAAAAEGRIALAFEDRDAAAPILADKSLVAAEHPPRTGEVADVEVELAAGVSSKQLLAALVNAGATLRLFEVVTPTLHQIFVSKVGNAAVAERREEAAS
jgi:ABC-2 type transport system ATP-binding protein